MGYDPGWYRSDGKRYHWNGRQWDLKDGGAGPHNLNPSDRPALPPGRSPDEPDPKPPSPPPPGALALIGLVSVVILILSQLVQSLRWPLLIACLVAAVAFLGRVGESRLFAAVVCVVTGLGALWGFSLQSEEDNRPPAEILYARKLLVDLATGNSEPCRSMPEEEQRRLAERYEVDDCAAAEEAIEASIDGDELERLKEVTGTVLENRELQGEGDGERTTLHSVRLDENPLGWEEIDFTYSHRKGFLIAVR